MAITAKNYAAQAEYGLRKYAESMNDAGFKGDSKIIKRLSEDIKKSVHFSSPDDARIFDDDLRGIKDSEVRLPFPMITLEYYATGTHLRKQPTNADVQAPKRVVLAKEISREYVKSYFPENLLLNDSDVWIHIMYATTPYLHDDSWVCGICSWIMPSKWDDAIGATKIFGKESNRPAMVGFSLFMPEMYDYLKKEQPQLNIENDSAHDISSEVAAVLELCEALSCSNVTHEPIEKISQSLNDKRIRKGKLPIYETRILVINAGQKNAESGDATGTHASPRQHLRRGHIRRLPKENIWINSCVVGSAKNGIIDKSYDVKA